MKKRRFMKMASIVLGAAMLFTMTGCGGSGAGSSSGSSSASGDDSGKFVIRQALTEELNSLDPNYNYSATSMGMIGNVNEGLYKYGEDGTVVEGLASNVEVSEDGCTYTFTIRDDARWSNGDPVTANDFYYSWRRLANPDNGCTYAYMLITAGVKNAYEVCYGGADLDELGISVTEDGKFVVEVDAPRAYFTDILASGTYFMPVNQKFCEESGDQFMLDIEHSIFCGPYVMSDWEVGGTSYTLTKNEDYYAADTVNVEVLEYSIITDAQQKVLAWENGDLDLVTLTGDYISMYADDPDIDVLGLPGIFFISFNTENEYLGNHNLRQAISRAINKDTIVNNILCDESLVANYAIPADFAKDSEGVTYRENVGNPEYNTYDVDSAVEYWDAAKKELGTDSITIELLYNEDSSLASIAAYVQSELQTNLPGITVELRCTSYNQRLTDMGNGDYDMGITRWYADYQDASTFLDMWIEDSNLNYGSWYDKEYNDLYQSVIGELATNEDERIKTQAEMEKIFMEDAAICPLYQASQVSLIKGNLELVYNPSGYAIIKYTKVAE